MPRFSFHVLQDKFLNAHTEADCESSAAARQEAVTIYADLARDMVAESIIDTELQIEVADETGKPIFRITVLAESLN